MFNKLTKNVLNISALADRPTMSAEELKAFFDKAGLDIKNFLNDLIEQMAAETAGEHIGVNVESVATKTLQAVLTAFEEAIAERYTKGEVNTSLAQETNNLIADFDVNLTTGVITVTKKDGTTETFDTALEKVPAKFEIVEENEVFYLKITNTDSTSTKVNVNTLFNEYLFNNSDEISFEVTNDGNSKKVVARIRDNSIGMVKLNLDVVSQLEGYVTSASSSATAAANSAASAKNSADSAEANAATAVNSANTAKTSANTATTGANTATTNATISKSYAVGGTGTRAGEDTDNAKYYAQQAKDIVGGDFLSKTGDASNTTVAFAVPDAEEDLVSGEKLGTIVGKTFRWLKNIKNALSNFATKDKYGDTAISLGRRTDTGSVGNNSVAVGDRTQANSSYSVAIGSLAQANAMASVSLGRETRANGTYSVALGEGTITKRQGSVAAGTWNVEDTSGELVHIVGNGTSSSARSNAHTVNANGTTWFQGPVYVGSTSGTNKDAGSVAVALTNQVIPNDVVKGFWYGTKEAYDALGTYDDKILYLTKKEG